MQERAIRFKELKNIVPASRSTIFRWDREGKFPKHFNLGKNSVSWLASEVAQCIKNQSKSAGERDNVT